MTPTRPTVNVGVHPSNTTLFLLRRNGLLEGLLDDAGADVRWVDYEDGRQTVELIGAGEIDVAGTGNTPPLRAQAEGIDVVYVAISEPRPEHGVIVVHEESPVRSVADLRGRRIALSEGSFQTTLLAFALDAAGLSYGDVETVSATHAGGRELFEAGGVDAWVGGDPELAHAQRNARLRRLVDTAAVHSNRSVWFARRPFVEEQPELLDAVVTALARTDAGLIERPRDAAELLAREVAGSPSADVWEVALRRRPWGPRPVDHAFVEEQQRAADLLARQGLLPRTITVADAVVAPAGARAGVAS
jgi:sulfonate transport system substrate-binding protein